MKNLFIAFILFLFLTTTSFGQKKIQGTLIEGTNIMITASAETVSKVNFVLKASGNGDYEKKFKTVPFNQFTFKQALIKQFEDIQKSTTIEGDFEGYLKTYSNEKGKKDNKYYEAKIKIDQKIDYLYNMLIR